jgi:DNA polymerase-3 subunit delta'
MFFEPGGRTLRGEDAEHLVIEASRSPVEGRRKIIVCDRFHTAEPGAAASLLKTIEEPAATSMFVLLAEEVPPEHVTIASRCTVIDFGEVSEDVVAEWLVGQGIAPDLAAVAAQSSRGDLRRARLLASDPEVAARRALWVDAPSRIDGTGAAVAAVVDEIRAAIDRAQGPLDALHAEEAAEFERQAEQLGVTATARKDMTARHKRETRRLRDDELRFGFAVLAAHYRNLVEAGESSAAIDAIDALRDTTEALLRNPNESLQLQRLFLRLSPSVA